jgi:hypothetical protein
MSPKYPTISLISSNNALMLVEPVRWSYFKRCKDMLGGMSSTYRKFSDGDDEKYLSQGEELMKASKQLVQQNSPGYAYYGCEAITNQQNHGITVADIIANARGEFKELAHWQDELVISEENYIEKQDIHYQSMKSELLDEYEGKYIFFEDGQVKGSSDNEGELIALVYEKYGIKDMLIKHVVREKQPPQQIYTPFAPFD